MGQVLDIRWRYMAVATNNGETVIIPNGSFSKSRIMVLARRGDKRIAWRREVAFGVSYDTAPARVIAAVEAGLHRAEIPNVATAPRPDVLFHSFGDNAYELRRPLLARRSRPGLLDGLAGAGCTSPRRSRATRWKFRIRIAC